PICCAAAEQGIGRTIDPDPSLRRRALMVDFDQALPRSTDSNREPGDTSVSASPDLPGRTSPRAACTLSDLCRRRIVPRLTIPGPGESAENPPGASDSALQTAARSV